MCKITTEESASAPEESPQFFDKTIKKSKMINLKWIMPKTGIERTRKIPPFEGDFEAKTDKKAQRGKTLQFWMGIK